MSCLWFFVKCWHHTISVVANLTTDTFQVLCYRCDALRGSWPIFSLLCLFIFLFLAFLFLLLLLHEDQLKISLLRVQRIWILLGSNFNLLVNIQFIYKQSKEPKQRKVKTNMPIGSSFPIKEKIPMDLEVLKKWSIVFEAFCCEKFKI